MALPRAFYRTSMFTEEVNALLISADAPVLFCESANRRPAARRAAGATSLNFLAVRREKGQIERAWELHAAMPSPLKRPAGQPVVLRWHPGGAGALWDENLNFHSRRELLDWAANGIDFVVLDHATGADITRVFLAHWNDSHTEVIDPVGRKHD